MFENKEAPLVSVVIPCYNHENMYRNVSGVSLSKIMKILN